MSNLNSETNIGVGGESAADFRVPATGNPDLDDIALAEGAELVSEREWSVLPHEIEPLEQELLDVARAAIREPGYSGISSLNREGGEILTKKGNIVMRTHDHGPLRGYIFYTLMGKLSGVRRFFKRSKPIVGSMVSPEDSEVSPNIGIEGEESPRE